MGNKSSKQKSKKEKHQIENDKQENNKIEKDIIEDDIIEDIQIENDKIENDKIEDIDVTSILSQINQSRKEELMKFLLSNSKSDEELKKYIEKKTKIKNDKLFYPFTLKYQILKNISFFSEDKSLFILISNDVILVPNGPIYHNEKLSDYFSFSQIEGDICCDSLHMIIENDCFNNKFSIIKIYDENFTFENHFEK